MRQYGIYEAKTKFAELIKQVQQGEHITITNRGKPVADIVPNIDHNAQEILDAIKAIKSMKLGTMNEEQYNEMRLKGRR